MSELWTNIQLYFANRLDEYMMNLWEHIGISFSSLFLAVLIGVPLGCLCATYSRGKKWIVRIFQILRIVPSLAVLLLLIPIMGTGVLPATTALVLLAVPPILMNTTDGFAEASAFVLDTAKGMGMTGKQIFWKVKMPLALPYMLTGARIAMIEIIASATIAAKIGAGGLGGIIFTGLGLNRADLLVVGGASVALLSVLSGMIFNWIKRIIVPWGRLEKRRR